MPPILLLVPAVVCAFVFLVLGSEIAEDRANGATLYDLARPLVLAAASLTGAFAAVWSLATWAVTP